MSCMKTKDGDESNWKSSQDGPVLTRQPQEAITSEAREARDREADSIGIIHQQIDKVTDESLAFTRRWRPGQC